MLFDVVSNKGTSVMQVTKVTEPVRKGIVNVNEGFHDKLKRYTFSDNRSGYWWLEDRIAALFSEKGEYWARMNRYGQLNYIKGALKGMNEGTHPRWNANRLIIDLFNPEADLHVTRMPTPPCMITIAFIPIRDQLSMAATFRAQYTDAKGYGNLYSLAMLLRDIAQFSGFKPRHLYSTAQKATLKYNLTEARAFRIALL